MDKVPFIEEDSGYDVCWFCPSLRFPAGGFDVYERPTLECPFDPADGFRYAAGRVPVCVHPYKVGLPPGRYASAGEPVPAREPEPAADSVPARRDEPDRVVAMPPVNRGFVRRPHGRRPARRTATPTARQARTDPGPYTGALPPGLPEDIADLAEWIRALVDSATPESLADVLAGAEAAALTRFPEEQVIAVLRRALSGG
ncbi:hypothetical protein GCM10010430_68050 [Kitasatospora cystarginea]|uniref:Uncharacterized protein n=1 Tax=Kitasatospora cystarginea TaxID=58350 RepID=A0ABN3EUT3_9ACTN